MTEDLWYKNSVIYSLDLETFMDLNGDGVGDFRGLATKLDYLNALGIDTLWLAPFQVTPNKDNGYDIKDYYTVDPCHGSLGNFVEFMHQARKRGIKVILDLVVNHTSKDHPWFQQSRSSKDSPFRDWYEWSEEKPKNMNEGMVFPGVQETTWTWDDKAQAYYHHRFYEYQPDLNFDNEEVREEIRRIMGFWLELGIAGFRVDAVPFILESQHPHKKKQELRFEYLREMRRFLQWRKGDAIMLGEANVLPKENVKFFGEEGDGIHMMFNFYVNQFLFYGLASGDIEPLKKAIEETRLHFPTAQWAHFLRNHDELDLGRLSDKQREKVFERFGPEENMQLYERGIRRRLSPMLKDRDLIEMSYSLMFSLPGTPVLRYGDEIGMGDDLSLKERDAVRTPMQWSTGKNAGFSEAKELVHPVIDGGEFAYQEVNVETQRRQPDSLLNWMTSMIRLRKECFEIGLGDWQILDTNSDSVLCMCYDYKNSVILVLHNFSDRPVEVELKIEDPKQQKLVDQMTTRDSIADEKNVHRIELGRYGYRWFRAGDSSHFLSKGVAL